MLDKRIKKAYIGFVRSQKDIIYLVENGENNERTASPGMMKNGKQTNSLSKTKKCFGIVIPAFAATALLSVSLLSGVAADPSGESSIDDKALVTYGYLQTFREELKQEILNEIGTKSNASSDYEEVELVRGNVLSLAEGTEVIFRGGDAVIVSCSGKDGAGFTDLSGGGQCFSGDTLLPGHIYYKTKAESVAYIVITGERAAFTIRGIYAKH